MIYTTGHLRGQYGCYWHLSGGEGLGDASWWSAFTASLDASDGGMDRCQVKTVSTSDGGSSRVSGPIMSVDGRFV